ncbi:nitrate- and nitrite sensing domain-containing protein [Streptomyces sp. PT12]|uniref:sensor histidine kinase n=1 Tax=Streptomyces sp. PT12 TaxID=1510197 RepID=UPI00215B8FEB|nr:nitrate- and nitrite sensing domain-containing protein [Streptomyces sp. PT12]
MPTGDDGAPASTGSRFAPRNWRVATKLYAILLTPVLVALLLGGFRVWDAYETWQEADDAEAVAELVRASTAYAHALIDERDISADPLLRGQTDSPEVADARLRTDEAAEAFHARAEVTPLGESLRRRIAAFEAVEPQLEGLRQRAYTDEMTVVETEEGYVEVQHPLMSLTNEIGLGTDNITSYGRTVYAISLSKAASSLQRAIGTHLLVAPGPGDETTAAQLTAFGSYAYLENIARAEFTAGATPEDTERLARAMTDAATAVAADAPDAPPLDEMVQLIASGATPQQLRAQGLSEQTWSRAATAEFDAYRTVEQELVDRTVTEAGDIAASARRDIVVNAAVVVTALLLAFVLAALMARSMSRNMQRLRGAAFEVAGQRLPALVDQLSRTDPGDVDTRVAPTPVHSQDEIGEVARAFDQVHREAVRLAAEQALLRGNVNAIFTNLSARNQGLIERQLALISDLENNEADPEQLENLFKLDHLATRMRRNGENLLVLAGREPQHRWNQQVPLVDVMRAAASEVEAYARIDISGVPDNDIHGGVVNDLVHLLAELLENATSFSSPHTKVKVMGTLLPDGRVMIEIHDKGIGLSPDDFAEINKRLADPPAVDAAISRRMGLYVVGRLAERHGIRVQLRPSGEQAGTTSLVMLPSAITQGGGAPAPDDEFTVSRISPEAPVEPAAAPQPLPPTDARSAAEFGFDDSRYGPVPDPPPAPAAYDYDQGPAVPGAGTPRREEPVPSYDSYDARQPYDPPAAPAPEPPAAPPAFDMFRPTAESPRGGPGIGAQRVGFSGPDPHAAEYRSTTSAGLPRRERHRPRPEEEPAQRPGEPEPRPTPPQAAEPSEEPRWEGGPRREARTGGVTSSGLPRRVPRANLTEHPTTPEPTTPEPTPGGPAVSRDPHDVRGRLSSLHRGVQQGRGSARGTRNDDQER